MFERFTEGAREAVVAAEDEARGLGHSYIGTEHLLLGLLRTSEGAVGEAFRDLRVSADDARAQVVRVVGEGAAETPRGGQLPFTPRAKETLELALQEALRLGHGHVGAEHVLLGLARLNEGVGPVVLSRSGTNARAMAAALVEKLEGPPPEDYVEGFSREAPVATKVVAAARKRRRVPRWLVFAGTLALGILIGWIVWGL